MVESIQGVKAEVSARAIQFMKAKDISTAIEADAKKIGEFLNNKTLQESRRKDLANYLLKYENKDGSKTFTYEEAYKLAGKQVENEKAQAKAKITIPFINKQEYEKALAEAASKGKSDLYNFTLIENKEVLGMINANPKKYFKTDDKGELIKGSNGQYVFDPDKYKAEMVEDTNTDYKLQLKEREERAQLRGISMNAEKAAIKATGMDVRRDNTGLYRTLVGTAALAAACFGGVTATAAAGAGAQAGSSATAVAGAVATATNHTAQVIGGVAGAAVLPFIHDKDAKLNKRQISADLFNMPQEQEPKGQKIDLKPVEGAKIKQSSLKPRDINVYVPEACYEVQDNKTVKTIPYGGYWHYASLYANCENGKGLTSKQLQDLTKLLQPGKSNYSIQIGANNKERILQERIILTDGTEVCLLQDKAFDAKYAEMQRLALTARNANPNNKSTMKLSEQSVNVKDCNTGKMHKVKY